MESLELQRAGARAPDCDGLDAANSSGNFLQHNRRTADWAGAGLRLQRQEHPHDDLLIKRDSRGSVVLHKRSDSGQAGRVEVVSSREVMQSPHWQNAFGLEAKDRRYYELIEDTIHEEFEYRYFVVRDAAGEVCAVQPCFVLDLDLLTGAKPRIGQVTELIRRVWPRFMRARTLMMGCTAGEGHIDGENEASQRANAQSLASSILDEARKLKTRLVVLKEFPAKYRSMLECFVEADFTRIPSLPNVMLNIDHSSFEEYMRRALSGNARKNLRRKLKAAEHAAPIEMSVVDDVAPMIDEIYPLYLQVYHRSNLHFEKLTKEYFCGLGLRLGDKNRFFVWRQNGKIVAFGSCLLQGDTIHGEYLGLDYAVALDLHLYHYTFRDLISWGIAHGYKRFHSSALNYDPKFHLRYQLDQIDFTCGTLRRSATQSFAEFFRLSNRRATTRRSSSLPTITSFGRIPKAKSGRCAPRRPPGLGQRIGS